jgi:hypothetical protein
VIRWIALLSICVVLTVIGTLVGRRPILAAVCVTVLAAAYASGLWEPRVSPLWAIASFTVAICALPLTVVTAIVTDNLMDKYDWPRKG